MDPVVIGIVAIITGGIVGLAFVISYAKHRHEWGEVQEDGYQYCQKEGCGQARKPEIPACNHPEWEVYEKSTITSTDRYGLEKSRVTGTDLILKCKTCGDMKHHVFTIDGRDGKK